MSVLFYLWEISEPVSFVEEILENERMNYRKMRIELGNTREKLSGIAVRKSLGLELERGSREITAE